MQDELVTVLGVKISPDFMAKVNKVKEHLQQVADKMQKVATAGAVAGSALIAFTKLAGDGAVKLQGLSDSTGISSEKLQKLEYVAKASGASVDALNSDLASLTASLNDPTPGNFNEGLVLLGISSRKANGEVKKADEVLMEMADKIKGMSTVKAIEWGKKAGVSADTIKLLKQGKASIQELANEGEALGAIVPNKSVENLAKFSKAMSSLAMIGRGLANTFLASLAPSLNKVIELYKKFSIQNGGLIKSGIEKFGRQLGKVFEMVASVFMKVSNGVNSALQKFTPITKLFKNTNLIASALTVALGALAVGGILKVAMALKALALNPMTAIFLALIVVVEELYTWFNKGFEATGFYKLWSVFEKKFPTVAGYLKKGFDLIKEGVLNVVGVLKTLWDMVMAIAKPMMELGGVILDALKPVGEVLMAIFKQLYEATSTMLLAPFKMVVKVLGVIKEALGGVLGVFQKAGGLISKFTGFLKGKVSAPVPAEVQQATITAAAPSVPAPNTVTNNNSTTSNVTNNNTATGTTNVYIQAGGHDVGEVLGGVKREYGNSLNVTNAGQTGGGLIQ